ncbi:hypothetical protein GCM10025867_41430 [Frondihabitans sucicola]|uniref:4'-phosphopantetheinyl transferase superfamily protein n=1 Tax=Frondihabitans sucicola TaxID=1268041 RepID=A0ABM8GTW3_9MICO|nr:4'-phosphopantetheinyl transferase superfamily protein [Frondihabitans sucicola]BDZ51902.1 hypothetical protein GCM10025867_41430 [Frondihabitans sucicola]
MVPDGVRVELIDLDAASESAPFGDAAGDAAVGDAAGDAAVGDAAGVAAAGEAAAETLDPGERARAAALRSATDRRRYVAAHAWLRRLLGEATGVIPRDVVILRGPCSACGEPHGKPFVARGPRFSLSRSGGWAALAIGDTGELGIDLEAAQDHERLAPLRDSLLAPGESSDDLLRTWVRKEALLKASGEGLTRAMTTLRADDERVHDLSLPSGLRGAVALFTDASRPSARVRRR